MVTGELEQATVALDDPSWLRFLAACPDRSPFHGPPWVELLIKTYGLRGFAAVLRDPAGYVRAGVPLVEVRSLSGRRRLVSLPFTDECPVLAEKTELRVELAGALATIQERMSGPAIEVRDAIQGVGWHTSSGAVTHELDLREGNDAVCKRFHRSQVLRNIARAHREGVTVREATSHADMATYYGLHLKTRRRQGVPVQPRRFFDLLFSGLVDVGHASLLLAEAPDHRPIAGAVFLIGGGTTVYKFGASDSTSWSLRPNHLIFDQAIAAACARGDQRFDFGRTDLENTGLRAFKSGWGAVERPLVYSTLAPGASQGAHDLLSTLMGTAIRRGPSWLCRCLGELLYKYAG